MTDPIRTEFEGRPCTVLTMPGGLLKILFDDGGMMMAQQGYTTTKTDEEQGHAFRGNQFTGGIEGPGGGEEPKGGPHAFSTLAEADRFFNKHGIAFDVTGKVPDWLALQIAGEAVTDLRIARENGMTMPDAVIISDAAGNTGSAGASCETTVTPSGKIRCRVTLTPFAGEHPDIATRHRLHSLVHELAHAAHARAIGIDRYREHDKFGDDEKKIAERVSKYGATSPKEFVAETFAGIALGRKYDDEVLALYKKLGGPEVHAWKGAGAEPPPTPKWGGVEGLINKPGPETPKHPAREYDRKYGGRWDGEGLHHPFRGNQWVEGLHGAAAEAAVESAKAAKPKMKWKDVGFKNRQEAEAWAGQQLGEAPRARAESEGRWRNIWVSISKPEHMEVVKRAVVALKACRAAGLPMPDHIEVRAALGDTYAAAGPENGESRKTRLYLNPRIVSDASIRADHDRGFLVAENMEGVLVHELGHIAMFENLYAQTPERPVAPENRFFTTPEKQRWEDAIEAVTRATSVMIENPNEPNEFLRKMGRKYDDQLYGAELDTAAKVSAYATNNVADFIAETFTGMTYGKTYPDDVMRLYGRHQGPPVVARMGARP